MSKNKAIYITIPETKWGLEIYYDVLLDSGAGAQPYPALGEMRIIQESEIPILPERRDQIKQFEDISQGQRIEIEKLQEENIEFQRNLRQAEGNIRRLTRERQERILRDKELRVDLAKAREKYAILERTFAALREERDELDAALQQTQSRERVRLAADQAIGDLLAVLHGDGGHYTDKHGLKKSAQDAEKKIAFTRNALDSFQYQSILYKDRLNAIKRALGDHDEAD